MVEIVNELLILGACYHIICFSDFNIDPSSKLKMGVGFISIFVLVVIFNVGIVIRKQFISWRHNRKAAKKMKAIKSVVKMIKKAKIKKPLSPKIK